MGISEDDKVKYWEVNEITSDPIPQRRRKRKSCNRSSAESNKGGVVEGFKKFKFRLVPRSHHTFFEVVIIRGQ